MGALKSYLTKLLKVFSRLSLPQKFAFAGSLVLLLSVIVIGDWLTKKIEAGVTKSEGIATALLIDSLIAPLAQELESDNSLSLKSSKALERILEILVLKKRVHSIKIWKQNGQVAYSNNIAMIGKVFSPSINLKKAWEGSVVSECPSSGVLEQTGA